MRGTSPYSANFEEDNRNIDIDVIKKRLTFRLKIAYNRMRSLIESSHEHQYKLTITQMFILTTLNSRGAIDQSQLSRELKTDKMTITVAVRNLEKKGFILRRKSEIDRRRNSISLTPKSNRELKNMAASADRVYHQMRETFTREEYQQLIFLLGKLGCTGKAVDI